MNLRLDTHNFNLKSTQEPDNFFVSRPKRTGKLEIDCSVCLFLNFESEF